jgi:hypothetical protein
MIIMSLSIGMNTSNGIEHFEKGFHQHIDQQAMRREQMPEEVLIFGKDT